MTSSKSLLGNNGEDTVAVYNINNTVTKYKTAKLEPSTCRALAHELYIAIYSTEPFQLQSSVGSPTLRVSCSYSHEK